MLFTRCHFLICSQKDAFPDCLYGILLDLLWLPFLAFALCVTLIYLHICLSPALCYQHPEARTEVISPSCLPASFSICCCWWTRGGGVGRGNSNACFGQVPDKKPLKGGDGSQVMGYSPSISRPGGGTCPWYQTSACWHLTWLGNKQNQSTSP